MRRLAWLLALCLLLAGCRKAEPPPAPEEPPSPAPVAAPDIPAAEPYAISLDSLTVEVVVDWEDADRILSSLEELSRLLGEALAEKGCTVEEAVTVTIGTAGGITAQALDSGGVDAAFLPLEDLAGLEEGKAVEILACPDLSLAVAVAGLRADQRFCAVLPAALAETEAGRAFLETCYPGAAFSAAE